MTELFTKFWSVSVLSDNASVSARKWIMDDKVTKELFVLYLFHRTIDFSDFDPLLYKLITDVIFNMYNNDGTNYSFYKYKRIHTMCDYLKYKHHIDLKEDKDLKDINKALISNYLYSLMNNELIIIDPLTINIIFNNIEVLNSKDVITIIEKNFEYIPEKKRTIVNTLLQNQEDIYYNLYIKYMYYSAYDWPKISVYVKGYCSDESEHENYFNVSNNFTAYDALVNYISNIVNNKVFVYTEDNTTENIIYKEVISPWDNMGL